MPDRQCEFNNRILLYATVRSRHEFAYRCPAAHSFFFALCIYNTEVPPDVAGSALILTPLYAETPPEPILKIDCRRHPLQKHTIAFQIIFLFFKQSLYFFKEALIFFGCVLHICFVRFFYRTRFNHKLDRLNIRILFRNKRLGLTVTAAQ
jgi:hypothetical protein